ncbi:MAG: D-aminoacyl-tRNA deacylase [Candidatus Woesearchaeota archaeon]
MKASIIVSIQDPAGMNIKELLIGIHGFVKTTETFHGYPVCAKDGIKLYTTDKRTIDSEGIDTEVEGDFIIFATRHQAGSAKKAFCVHVPGNWSKAEAGGEDKRLCTALPAMMKEALNKISGVYGEDEFEIVQECTHHGPAIDKPCMFIEIGSTEEEWKRQDCGEVIAKVVNHITMNPVKKYKEVIVIGGGHYNQVATKLMLNTEYAVGHVCPKHQLQNLDAEMLNQMIAKNGKRFEMVVLDWKGLSQDKDRIVGILEGLGIKYDRYQRMSKEE